MGNSTSKHTIDEVVSVLSEKSDTVSERETTSAWYRYGVEITDVYQVLEVLGQGHMGEVFTVKRKTTGHHTKTTREGCKRESMEGNSVSKSGAHERKISLGSLHLSRKKSDETTKSKCGEKEPDKKTKSPTIKGAAHKVSKEATKVMKKIGGLEEESVEADARLEQFIQQDVTESHEPLSPHIVPKKGIIKTETTNRYSSNSSNSISAELESVDSDLSQVSLHRLSSSERAKRTVHFQRTFAVKTILTSRITKEQVKELVNEIMVMRKLDHPYVLKLYEVYHVKRKIWLVTELCTGGDLSTRKLNEYSVKNVIEQILRALVYLHRMGIIHRDLKLENVLYENHSKDATIRLIDFGLSRNFDRTLELKDYSRTPYTMTPEVASGKIDDAVSDKADVWAVGIIAWILLSGEFPFIKNSADLKDKEKMEKLKKANYHFGVTWKGRGITLQSREFVKGCLQKDPAKRWTSKQALENLQKSWGPEVDTIWKSWQTESKKCRKTEFVRAEDLPDYDEDTDDEITNNAVATDNNTSNIEGIDSDEDVKALDPAEVAARVKRIKKHVTKVVKKKQNETTIPTDNDTDVDIMREVERYTQFGFLKKKILITMANTMDRGDVGKLREWFLRADTNDTGTITLEELINAFKKISPDADEKKVEMLFNGIDRDRSGHIHYAEFLAALAESHGLVTMDRLTEAFDRIDKDGKGYITHDDLKEALGADYDKETVDKMIEEGDFKKNNKIDYEELLQLMFSDPVKGAEIVGNVTPATIARHPSLRNLSENESCS